MTDNSTDKQSEFEEAKPDRPLASGVSAASERTGYDDNSERPNSFFLRFGKLGYISWQSSSDAAVLSFMVLIVLCIVQLIMIIGSINYPNAPAWIQDATRFIGHGISALIGAIVGASATAGRKR